MPGKDTSNGEQLLGGRAQLPFNHLIIAALQRGYKNASNPAVESLTRESQAMDWSKSLTVRAPPT